MANCSQSETDLIQFNIFKSYDNGREQVEDENQAPLNTERFDIIEYQSIANPDIRNIAQNEGSPVFISNNQKEESFKKYEEDPEYGEEMDPMNSCQSRNF